LVKVVCWKIVTFCLSPLSLSHDTANHVDMGELQSIHAHDNVSRIKITITAVLTNMKQRD